jgi:undecaprenyl diphosphate synthase
MRVPRHLAIIMDGNGRWAQARGLARCAGHVEGATAAKRAIEAAWELGIEYLTLHAFGLASWSRPRAEIDAVMELLQNFADDHQTFFRERAISVGVSGALDDLPTKTRRALENLIESTAGAARMKVTFALSYGGRQDIVDAARSLSVHARAGLVLPEEIDQAFFRKHLTTSSLPPVDLLIRTGGETRLSDFMLFEAAYAELLFLPTLWPDFVPATLHAAVAEYSRRQRRFGSWFEPPHHSGSVEAFDPFDSP